MKHSLVTLCLYSLLIAFHCLSFYCVH